MKICKNCHEQSEDQFDSCWNCGVDLQEQGMVTLRSLKKKAKTHEHLKSEKNQVAKDAVALVKCKECDNEISSKAETCPKCGIRLKPSPIKNSGSGCIVGLFKLIGGLIGAGIALLIMVSLLSDRSSVTPSSPLEPASPLKTEVSPARQLAIRCEELSKAIVEMNGVSRSEIHDSCVKGGTAAIQAQERINSEGR